MIFRDADCGVVPVVEDGQPIGVLTDRDVALAVADYPDLASRSVADIMTKDVVSVGPDATLDELKEKFGAEGVRRLLVADAAGLLLGVISWADVVRPVARAASATTGAGANGRARARSVTVRAGLVTAVAPIMTTSSGSSRATCDRNRVPSALRAGGRRVMCTWCSGTPRIGSPCSAAAEP